MIKEEKNYKTLPVDPNLRIYDPDRIIMKQGEPNDGNIYILEDGSVAILINDEKVAEIAKTGVFIGEISSILKCPRTATVKTLETTIIHAYTGGIEDIIENSPSVTLKMIVQLARRLTNTTASVADLKKQFDELKQNLEADKQEHEADERDHKRQKGSSKYKRNRSFRRSRRRSS